ncbi:MAG: hypothetical protein PHP17_02990 [Candidatus Omnitrophica bacterium]|nr:hypothetical protein [Candidatus Omnitrophota bacterium]
MASRKIMLFVVLITSIITLELQLLQTRILSVVLWYHFVYIVITMALLGFAASGTVLHISRKLRELKDGVFYPASLLGLSAAIFISSVYGYYPVANTFALSPEPKIILGLIASYLILMLPYFFAGLVILRSFMHFPETVGKTYFINLLGSGLGCVLFIALIERIGAFNLVILTSVMAIAPLIVFIRKIEKYKIPVFVWILFLAAVLKLSGSVTSLKILPEGHKQFSSMYGANTVVEYTKWNPISRVDVISYAKDRRIKNILMDGDAQALFFDMDFVDQLRKASAVDRNTAYVIKGTAPKRTLIIGAGGGFDVIVAKLNNSKVIDAVEINPSTAYITSKKFAGHINNLYSTPGINLFVEDGRSFVRQTKNKYDIIVIYYTDSVLALSTGAYTLSDNFLYTKEAFSDYLDHLTDGGLIQIGRWAYLDKPREALRIFSIALTALKDKGYKNPGSHIIVVSSKDKLVGNVIFKKNPFTEEEKNKLTDFVKTNGLEIWYPQIDSVKVSNPGYAAPFTELAEAFKNNKERQFYNNYEFNVSPTTDDSPFFYNYNKVKASPSVSSNPYYDSIRGVWHVFVLVFMFINSLVLSVILVLLPLALSKKESTTSKNKFIVYVYFMSIGFAFMFLEMGLLQKFVLFLGSPIYSMAVLIPAILISAGLGSFSSSFIRKKINMWIPIVALTCAILIVVFTGLIAQISNIFLSAALIWRIIVAVLFVLPLAYFMGFAFPLALRVVSSKDSALVPWAWAINGSSSVIASIVAIIVAMAFGFKLVLIIAACFYVLAAVSALFFKYDAVS